MMTSLFERKKIQSSTLDLNETNQTDLNPYDQPSDPSEEMKDENKDENPESNPDNEENNEESGEKVLEGTG